MLLLLLDTRSFLFSTPSELRWPPSELGSVPPVLLCPPSVVVGTLSGVGKIPGVLCLVWRLCTRGVWRKLVGVVGVVDDCVVGVCLVSNFVVV